MRGVLVLCVVLAVSCLAQTADAGWYPGKLIIQRARANRAAACAQAAAADVQRVERSRWYPGKWWARRARLARRACN